MTENMIEVAHQPKVRKNRRVRLPLRHEHRRRGGCSAGGRWAAAKLKHRGVIILREYKFMCSSLGRN